jgi:type VI secretion system secreted protein VgrG
MPGASFAPAASLTGTIFLKDGGKANSTFIFYTGAGAALTTAPNSAIDVSGLSPTDSVFWVVGSSATLGVNSVFYGNILALDSISFNPAARDLCGRALAETGKVSFAGQAGVIENQVSIGCTGNLAGSNGLGGGLGGSGGGPTPESGTLLLVACGVFCIVLLRRHA